MQQVSPTTEVIRVIWPNSADKSHHNVLTKSEPTSKWTNDLRLVARTSADPKQAFSNASIMCSPSQNPHQNGPMICVWSRALQLTPSRRFQMPVLCAHQARTHIKMDQWSAFGRTHFSWPQAGVFKCQYYVLTRQETTQKWTNDLRLVAPTHAFHMPVHSSQLEFMTETSVHTQKLWNYENF